MNALILPTVTQIGLERIEHNQSSLNENAECLRRSTVVLMD
ncbi:uncharacterized protein METZ01_LOCUS365473, partial [marine metagenome]